MKKLLTLAILTLFIFTSCQNDEGSTTELDADDASAELESTADQMSEDIISLLESDGANAVLDLMDLLENSDVIGGRVSERAWTKRRLNLIVDYFITGPAARTGNDEPTSFDDLKGLYEWNEELGDFDKEDSEFFIVKFPTEGSETNNAELKISDLEFVTITEVYENFVDEYEVPSVIKGYLKVDEVMLVELSFDVDWSSNGNPEKADVELFVNPFTFELAFDDTFNESSSVLASISMDGEVITSIDVDIQFEDASKEEPVFFEGSVSYRSVKIAGDVDLKEIDGDGDPNDYVNLDIYSEGSKLGDIVFELEEVEFGFQDYVAYVQYSDGSKENLEDVLEPVFAEIDAIFEEFED